MRMLANDFHVESLPARAAPRIVTFAGICRGQPALMRILAFAGAVVEEVADLPAIMTRLRQEPTPELVVLEWGMPGMQWIEALQRVLESGRGPPLLVLGSSGKPGTAEEIELPVRGESRAGMESALGQLAQSLGLLVANAGLKSGETESRPPPQLEEGCTVVLHLDTCRAHWNGQRVDLSLTEFRIVSRLAASPGVDFSHRDIYDMIKGEGIVSGRGDDGYRANVRAAVKRIRRKFVRVDPAFSAIRSYHGFGYRWEESVPAEIVDAGNEGAPFAIGR